VLSQAAARELAARARGTPPNLEIDDSRTRELRTGWFFPYRSTGGSPVLGTNGLVVNKSTGSIFYLGSAFPVERDLVLYDKGYQFAHYDLVITTIADMERTLDTLEKLELSTVEPMYEHGVVWRIPRLLTRAEIRACLERLPHVFGGVHLYFRADVLEEARGNGWFEVALLGIQGA
jgi:hypothetical protein